MNIPTCSICNKKMIYDCINDIFRCDNTENSKCEKYNDKAMNLKNNLLIARSGLKDYKK